MSWHDSLDRGLSQLTFEVSSAQREQLVVVVEQLIKWNQAYNLTAVRDPLEMIPRHILDSLVIHPFLRPGRLLDVGTGPGFPGIPLAILDPQREFFLLDSNGKKTRFIKQLVHQLKLGNVTTVDTRVEQWQPEQPFDIVVSRAFASLSKMVSFSEHLLTDGGCWQAMKGTLPKDELEALPDYVTVAQVTELQVPQLTAQRHLITLERRPVTAKA